MDVSVKNNIVAEKTFIFSYEKMDNINIIKKITKMYRPSLANIFQRLLYSEVCTYDLKLWFLSIALTDHFDVVMFLDISRKSLDSFYSKKTI